MQLDLEAGYGRLDNTLYQDGVPIVRFTFSKFPDYDELSPDGVKYMQRYIEGYKDRNYFDILPGYWTIYPKEEDIIEELSFLDIEPLSERNVKQTPIELITFTENQQQYRKMENLRINLNNTVHDFEKQNLVTIARKGGGYDKLKCKNCGLTAKTTQLGYAEFDGKPNIDTANNCSFDIDKAEFVGKEIEVTRCTAQGSSFANLTPQSRHIIVEAPKPYRNDMTGVWVLGVNEAVKLLRNEFKFIEKLDIPTKKEQPISKFEKAIDSVTKKSDFQELKAEVLKDGEEAHNPTANRLEQVKFYVNKGIISSVTIAKLIDANPSYVYRLVKQAQEEK